jgi:hypothetical protein
VPIIAYLAKRIYSHGLVLEAPATVVTFGQSRTKKKNKIPVIENLFFFAKKQASSAPCLIFVGKTNVACPLYGYTTLS